MLVFNSSFDTIRFFYIEEKGKFYLKKLTYVTLNTHTSFKEKIPASQCQHSKKISLSPYKTKEKAEIHY